MSNIQHIHINETTFVKAYEDYWKDLYVLCNRYVQDPELSKELVQELFISIWEKRGTNNIHTSLKHYLFSALKLKIMEHYRKQAVREKYITYKSNESTAQLMTEESVFYNELQRAFNTVIGSLPERSQQVYRLSREKGMDNKSIAAALMITEKAVEGNMTRAIQYVRKRLKMFNE